MRNGSHNMHTYRADHAFPRNEARWLTSSTAKRVYKKHHHKKQRSWDNKLIKEGLNGK